MRISELIVELEKAKEKHGDIQVKNESEGLTYPVRGWYFMAAGSETGYSALGEPPIYEWDDHIILDGYEREH